MTSALPCPICGCGVADPAHAVLSALRDENLDAAIELGLLDVAPCPACGDACSAPLLQARDERRFALAARDRHRARTARLQRRAADRDARRVPAPATSAGPASSPLPPAAAAALARAKAKAAARKPR